MDIAWRIDAFSCRCDGMPDFRQVNRVTNEYLLDRSESERRGADADRGDTRVNHAASFVIVE